MEGIQKKSALTMSFDGGHFGIYTVGEVTIYVSKKTCLVAPTGTVIDVYNLDFLILQISDAIKANPVEWHHRTFSGILLKQNRL
ncbi:MAG: hypothetical protein V2J65_20405 [Desulfobacteraceae bacterium]|jgi:hypothetical protein|nr:hypothetical protein [Desulfobacteraceae bacterium]